MITRKLSFIKKYKEDILSFFILVFASIPVRVIQLTNIPFGLHGDEAWSGLDARAILANGHIPAYTGNALGQPTGPLYLTALIFKLLGDSIFSLRLSMAIFGILTVAAFYVLLRLLVRKEAAFISTVMLAFSLYHVHFSRIAYMLISAPFFQIVGLIFLILGRRKNNLWLMGLSGLTVGLGMHTYNAYVLFPITVFALLIFDFVSGKFKLKGFAKLGIFILGFALASYPLLKMMATNGSFYFSHHKSFFIFNTDRVSAIKDNGEKIKLIVAEGSKNVSAFFMGGKVDGADGLGKYHTFGMVTLIFFLIGAVNSLAKKNRKYIFFLLSLFMFLSACFLTIDGVYRRQILGLPYIYLFASLGIQTVIDRIKNHRLHDYVFAVIFVLVMLEAGINMQIYFRKFPNDQETKFVFAEELVRKINNYKKGFYEEGIINLQNSTCKCDYETVRYLAPGAKCVD